MTLSMQGVLHETCALLSSTAVAPAGSLVSKTSCAPFAGLGLSLTVSSPPGFVSSPCVPLPADCPGLVAGGCGPRDGTSIGLGFLSSAAGAATSGVGGFVA